MTETLQDKIDALEIFYSSDGSGMDAEVISCIKPNAVNKAIQELREEIKSMVCSVPCDNIACIELKKVLSLIGEKK